MSNQKEKDWEARFQPRPPLVAGWLLRVIAIVAALLWLALWVFAYLVWFEDSSGRPRALGPILWSWLIVAGIIGMLLIGYGLRPARRR